MKFRGEYWFLSNMYPCSIKVGDYTFTCVEAAYQALKCPSRAKEFVGIDGFEAKKLGSTVKMEDSFDRNKVSYMYGLLRIKFCDEELKNKLLAVHGEIVEDNWWNDGFWGLFKGHGTNVLGNLLTIVRTELMQGDNRRQEYRKE